MNWLLLQLLVITLIPISFIGLLVFSLRRRPRERPRLTRWWILTIFLFALWSTRQITPYFGREIPELVSYFWRAFAHYPLVLAGSTLLLATVHYIDRPLPFRWLYGAGPLLAAAALALDPALWGYTLVDIEMAGLALRHFDLWAIIWVTAWLLPVLTAWIWSESIMRQAPASIYRNRTAYWVAIVTVFLAGGSLTLLRDFLPAQQGGAILLLVSSYLGMLAITRSDLPDLPNTLRQLGYHFSRGLIVFIIAGLALFALSLFIVNAAGEATSIVLFAALLTLVLLGLLAAINRLARRWFFGRLEPIDTLLLAEPVFAGYQSPEVLAGLFEREIQQQFGARGGWIAAVEEGPAGGIVVRPLGGSRPPETILFDGTSPFTRHLQESDRPLTPEDIAHLPAFASLASGEAGQIARWGAAVYLPLRAERRLVGLLVMHYKRSGERYQHREFTAMTRLGRVMGMALAQSRALQALQASTRLVYGQNEALIQEWRRLKELAGLYEQFTALLSPERLRQPFLEMALTRSRIDSALGRPAADPAELREDLAQLQREIDQAQGVVDDLIGVAAHLEKQAVFCFAPVYLDQVARTAVDRLEDMAAGRQNRVEIDVRGRILPVWGDPDRLVEAVQQLVHNGLKFNRINGRVTLTCQMVREEVSLEIRDEGVGIPPDRLGTLWDGLRSPYPQEPTGARRRSRIGLPLVKFIVQAHGGRIEVDSTHGQGSTFTLYLPARVP